MLHEAIFSVREQFMKMSYCALCKWQKHKGQDAVTWPVILNRY